MKHFRKMIWPYIVWAGVIVVLPLLMIILYSVTKGGNELLNIQFTFENFKRMTEPIYVDVFVKSFKLGILSVIICFLVGYTLAYLITSFSEKVQSILILIVTIPMWINTLLRTYAWISLLSDNGLINTVLVKLGFEPINMMYTDFAVVLGLVSDLLPFMVIPIYTSLSKMDHSLIEAAYDLGANKFKTFWRVTFKLSIPGVLNGVIMTFLLSISTFVIPKLLGGGQYTLIGNLIENQFISIGDWNFGSAISVILAFIILMSITFMKKIDKDEIEEE
ncbi:MAG: ABC transporter permease [Lachnospiraceae bacterium]|nr:ABC transporter permease [Lachnospiraceae bacterium]